MCALTRPNKTGSPLRKIIEHEKQQDSKQKSDPQNAHIVFLLLEREEIE